MPSGSATDVRLLQPENAPSAMLVTLDGIVTLVRAVNFMNAYSPMEATPSSSTTSVISP